MHTFIFAVREVNDDRLCKINVIIYDDDVTY